MKEGIDFKIKEIKQIGIVVKDVQKAIKSWTALGLGPWTMVRVGSEEDSTVTYRGKVCPHDNKIACAKVGSIEIELIEPVSGKSPHSDFLAECGEGVQHIGVNVEDPFETAKQLKELGYEEMMAATGIGPMKDGKAVYVDTESGLAIALELVKPPTIPDSFKLD